MDRENLARALETLLIRAEAVYNTGRDGEAIAQAALVFTDVLFFHVKPDRTAEPLREAFVMHFESCGRFPTPSQIIDLLGLARIRILNRRREAAQKGRSEVREAPGNRRRTPGIAAIFYRAWRGEAEAIRALRELGYAVAPKILANVGEPKAREEDRPGAMRHGPAKVF